MSEYVVEMKDIQKSFGEVRAVRHGMMNLKKGEVHSLIGENGAGKSTMMKMLYGMYGRYPGGFLDLISEHVLQMDVDKETKLGSRLVTGVFLFVMTVVPFLCGDAIPMFVVTLAVFSIFEGCVHIAGIKLFQLNKPYTPGMVTAEIELVTAIALIVYLAANHLAAWYDYVFAPFVFIACFAVMQRSLMGMIGLRYKDMLAVMKKRLGK